MNSGHVQDHKSEITASQPYIGNSPNTVSKKSFNPSSRRKTLNKVISGEKLAENNMRSYLKKKVDVRHSLSPTKERIRT